MIRPFYLFLMVLWGGLLVYTGHVVLTQGWGLFPIFFGDIAAWTWPGQFNLDFTIMLFLSASWTVWRYRGSPGGWILGLLAFVGGAGFQLPHLTWLSWKHGGDTKAVLLGARDKE